MIARPPSVLLLALMVAGCGDPQRAAKSGTVDPAADDNAIECALHGAAEFSRECTVARTADARGLILTINAPDGGFRRLRVASDGRGVVAADGALPAIVTVIGQNRIEVRISDDRYRLPATVR